MKKNNYAFIDGQKNWHRRSVETLGLSSHRDTYIIS